MFNYQSLPAVRRERATFNLTDPNDPSHQEPFIVEALSVADALALDDIAASVSERLMLYGVMLKDQNVQVSGKWGALLRSAVAVHLMHVPELEENRISIDNVIAMAFTAPADFNGLSLVCAGLNDMQAKKNAPQRAASPSFAELPIVSTDTSA